MTWLWGMAYATGLAVIYGLNITADMDPISRSSNVIYAGFHRAAWGLALGWLIFACCRGYGGWINEFLSWGAFVPLSRMSYIIYLMHITVINFTESIMNYYIPGTNTMMVCLNFAIMPM